jgi:hypothetical protein
MICPYKVCGPDLAIHCRGLAGEYTEQDGEREELLLRYWKIPIFSASTGKLRMWDTSGCCTGDMDKRFIRLAGR